MFQSTSKSSSSEYNSKKKKVNKNHIPIADYNRLPPAPTSNTPTQLFVDEEESKEPVQKKGDNHMKERDENGNLTNKNVNIHIDEIVIEDTPQTRRGKIIKERREKATMRAFIKFLNDIDAALVSGKGGTQRGGFHLVHKDGGGIFATRDKAEFTEESIDVTDLFAAFAAKSMRGNGGLKPPKFSKEKYAPDNLVKFRRGAEVLDKGADAYIAALNNYHKNESISKKSTIEDTELIPIKSDQTTNKDLSTKKTIPNKVEELPEVDIDTLDGGSWYQSQGVNFEGNVDIITNDNDTLRFRQKGFKNE